MDLFIENVVTSFNSPDEYLPGECTFDVEIVLQAGRKFSEELVAVRRPNVLLHA